ncbi:MAG: CopG family antitoxin [Planctomycetota bacterium]
MTGQIPVFRNEAEEALFWDTHDATEYLSDLEEDRGAVFVRPERGVIELSQEVWQALVGIARRRRTTPARLLQRWLDEELERSRAKRKRPVRR